MSSTGPAPTADDLNLTIAERGAIASAARPLRLADRPAFVSAVLAALQGHRENSLGLVHRVAREVQRKFFDAPIETGEERR
jgi:hypothetical protein